VQEKIVSTILSVCIVFLPVEFEYTVQRLSHHNFEKNDIKDAETAAYF